jgi:hypothetical protein
VPAAAELIPLNRSEHMYWAAEGYFGPINQPYILRFDGPVDTELVRRTMRELVTNFPRLRGVVEPTGLSYRLRILPDDQDIDQLFADAFRVQAGVDASSRQALESFHTQFMNETISLERGMGWRARLIQHPTQPAMMFSVHHILGDGRSMVLMLCAILARLNGEPMKPSKIDSPSMLPAEMPLKWWHWPSTLLAAWRNGRADKLQARGLNIVSLARRRGTRCTTAAVAYHELPCPTDTMRALAKAHGTTVNTLLTALVANTFLALAKDDPKAAAALRISVDLRRYYPEGQSPEFGNYVYSFTALGRRQATLKAQINSLETQVKDHLGRFERREYGPELAVLELLPLLGRNLYSLLVARSKAKGGVVPLSCHLTNLGNAEFINPKGATVRLQELWPTTLSPAFLIVALSMGGKQCLTLVSQNCDIPPEAIAAFRAELDKQLQHLMHEAKEPAHA